eukprot:9134796-Pyramimonas_sp.AAC.2
MVLTVGMTRVVVIGIAQSVLGATRLRGQRAVVGRVPHRPAVPQALAANVGSMNGSLQVPAVSTSSRAAMSASTRTRAMRNKGFVLIRYTTKAMFERFTEKAIKV